MNIVEQSFQRVEFNKFILKKYDEIPAETETQLLETLRKYQYRIDAKKYYTRLSQLKSIFTDSVDLSFYAKEYGIRGIKKFTSSNGAVIYKMPLFSFPINKWKTHHTNSYLIIDKELTLVDCATALSEGSLKEALKVITEIYGNPVEIADIKNVIITHAHFDHFGGLAFLTAKYTPRIFAHKVVATALRNVEKMFSKINYTIGEFLRQAAVPVDEIEEMTSMHAQWKNLITNCPNIEAVSDGDIVLGKFEVIHTPGHSPGLICLKFGDVIFLGDHIIEDITPHQFPRFYMRNMGLVHYIPSLLKICARIKNVRLGLAGHNDVIPNVKERAMDIIHSHHEKMAELLTLLDKPKNLYEITRQYFIEVRGKQLRGYERILGIEEIAAHLEYLTHTLGVVEIIESFEGEQKILLYKAV